MKILCALCFFVFAVTQNAHADESTDYLAPITPNLEAEALEEFGVRSCEEFEKYIQIESKRDEFVGHYLNGIKHDIGLCTKQDFSHAILHYKKSLELFEEIPDPYLRLSLIYKYGPESIRDVETAEYYAQKALNTEVVKVTEDKELLENYIRRTLNGHPIPDFIKKYM